MSKFPWVLSLFFAFLAAAGWWNAFDTAHKDQIQTNRRQELVRELVSQREFEADEMLAAEGSVEACMNDPQVKRNWERRAKRWAEEVSNQVLEDYKETVQQEKEERLSERMDQMQDFFSNAVNQYSESNDVDPAVSQQLHELIESGFEKQRELHRQMLQGEISDREFRQRRREYRQEGRASVMELLGEEQARDFTEILREEREKAQEEQSQIEDNSQ
ncbi:MAG: hypothetical protein VX278_23440 [Myxococcota bacterium]|nr:hypothetical protein [Myxococcota bacterium]